MFKSKIRGVNFSQNIDFAPFFLALLIVLVIVSFWMFENYKVDTRYTYISSYIY